MIIIVLGKDQGMVLHTVYTYIHDNTYYVLEFHIKITIDNIKKHKVKKKRKMKTSHNNYELKTG